MFNEWVHVGRSGCFFFFSFFFLETFKEWVGKLNCFKGELQYLGCKNIPEQHLGWEMFQNFLELPH